MKNIPDTIEESFVKEIEIEFRVLHTQENLFPYEHQLRVLWISNPFFEATK